MSEVKVYDDQLEKALKILKRKLAQDGTFKEIKKRRFYEKPCVKKKRKRQEAAKRRAKASKKSAKGCRNKRPQYDKSPAERRGFLFGAVIYFRAKALCALRALSAFPTRSRAPLRVGFAT